MDETAAHSSGHLPMNCELTLDRIRGALQGLEPRRTPFPGRKTRAAVAVILAGENNRLHMALIRRAEREGDPWSGHMALPGGRAQSNDPHPQGVAERETREEVGIQLEPRHRIADLDEMPVHLGLVDTGIVLTPIVYHIGAQQPPFALNGEVAKAYWVPIDHLFNPANLVRKTVVRQGNRLQYPAIAYQGQTIWGLTYRVLGDFSRLIGCPLPENPPAG